MLADVEHVSCDHVPGDTQVASLLVLHELQAGTPQGYLRELLKAIKEDKANVIGYTTWTIMDDFEWNGGYLAKFGLYSVNFSDPLRPRKEKLSVGFWKHFLFN